IRWLRGCARVVRVPNPDRSEGPIAAAISVARHGAPNGPELGARVPSAAMPSREIAKFRDDLAWLLRHVVGCLDGLTDAEINWRPPAKDANSLLVLATHTLGAAEDHLVRQLGGQDIARVRATGFPAPGG